VGRGGSIESRRQTQGETVGGLNTSRPYEGQGFILKTVRGLEEWLKCLARWVSSNSSTAKKCSEKRVWSVEGWAGRWYASDLQGEPD
jgi:hypothetical protein